MAEAPANDAEAIAVRDRALSIPTLSDTLVSGDGRAMALYIPIREKNDSYRVASRLREHIEAASSPAEFHITGLPIAQDQFGVEMFKQMAISAPAAMVLILVLMWLFFGTDGRRDGVSYRCDGSADRNRADRAHYELDDPDFRDANRGT